MGGNLDGNKADKWGTCKDNLLVKALYRDDTE